VKESMRKNIKYRIKRRKDENHNEFLKQKINEKVHKTLKEMPSRIQARREKR